MTSAISLIDFGIKNPSPLVLLEEDEIGKMLDAFLRVADVPRTKRDPAPKTALFDLFGAAKAGKTTITGNIERAFTRKKMNIFCPPETAEHEEIRNKSSDSPVVFQARHLNGVERQVLNLSQSRDFHAAIISRGLIDMLYWYEKGVREGVYTGLHQAAVNEKIFEMLRLDLVDAFIFFSCRPEVAMERELASSVVKKPGSKMNIRTLTEAQEIYAVVIKEVQEKVPGLPLFQIDTSDITLQEASQRVLSLIIPSICQRFGVSDSSFLPLTPSLVRKRVATSDIFEEQLKLRGHPKQELLEGSQWQFVREGAEDDTYINPNPNQDSWGGFFGEIARVRKEFDGTLKFMYKGLAQDRILSHRKPLTLVITPEQANEVLGAHPTIKTVRKKRRHFRFEPTPSVSDSHFFTLHVDAVEGLGEFTEIRARGSSGVTHDDELFKLATELGFNMNDIVKGSYLALSINK